MYNPILTGIRNDHFRVPERLRSPEKNGLFCNRSVRFHWCEPCARTCDTRAQGQSAGALSKRSSGSPWYGVRTFGGRPERHREAERFYAWVRLVLPRRGKLSTL